MPPAVSVIMATRNAERYLAQALDSLVAQTARDFEVIIIDGGSTDRTLAIAGRYPTVTCLGQRGRGFAVAWNEGIARAQAPLVCFLDSDDLWHPEKLDWQSAYLNEHPETDYVVGRVKFFAEQDQGTPAGFNPDLLDGDHVAFMPGTIMLRRRVFDEIGLFEPNWRIASDLVWFQRLREGVVPFGVIDRVVLWKRVHDASLSHTTAGTTLRGELFALLRAGLERRRGDATQRTTRPETMIDG